MLRLPVGYFFKKKGLGEGGTKKREISIGVDRLLIRRRTACSVLALFNSSAGRKEAARFTRASSAPGGSTAMSSYAMVLLRKGRNPQKK